MSYDVPKEKRRAFTRARGQRWWTTTEMMGLANGLSRVDYSVVASRHETHVLVVNFRTEKGKAGSELYGISKRFDVVFPDNDLHYGEADLKLSLLLAEINGSLSWRSGGAGQAKDVTAGVEANQGQKGNNYTEKNQEVQDNTKKYQELVKGLYEYIGSNGWFQEDFEEALGVKWNSGKASGAA